MVRVDILERAHLLHEQLDGHDAEQVRNMKQVRNGEDEVILAIGDSLLLVSRERQVLLGDLLHVRLVLLLYHLLAISDDDDVGVAGVHLVEGVHHHREGFVAQDEQNYCSLLFLIAFDQSYRTVFHLTSPQGLSMDVVKLLYLQGCLFGDRH